MRPLELELTRFRSYEHASVDLRPYELVVIAGDTGAGKSSLLDAISFALFARTPELAAGTSELVSLGEDHGEVRLTFQMDGVVWRATRRLGGRAPQPRHLLERLAHDGGEVVESVEGERDVSERVSRIVGLSFEAFTSTVLLAQGQFARFFQARPGERDDILRELFAVPSLEPARAAALAATAAAGARADAFEAEASRLPATPMRLRIASAREARRAASAASEAGGLLPTLTEAREAERATADARRAAAEATEALRGLPSQEARAAMAADVGAAIQAHEIAQVAHARAARSAAEATADRAGAEARHGGDHGGLAERRALAHRLGELEAVAPARAVEIAARQADLVARRAALASGAREIEALGARQAELAQRADAIRAHLEVGSRRAQCEEAVAAARTEAETREATRAQAHEASEHLRAAQRASVLAEHAAHLWADLRPGDDCPVCGQQIGFLPGPSQLPPSPAREAADRAEEVLSAAVAAHAEAEARLARAEGELAAVGQLTLVALDPADSDAGTADADALAHEAQAIAEALREPVRAAEVEAHAIAVEAGRLEAVAAQVAADADELARLRTALGGFGADAAAAVESAWIEINELVRAERVAQGVERQASERLEAARAVLAQVERDLLGPVRIAVAGAAQRAGVDPGSVDGDLAHIEEACTRVADALATRLAQADSGARQAAEARAQAMARLAAVGIDSVDDAQRRIDALRAERTRTRTAHALAESAAGEARRLLAAAAHARREAALHALVAADLRADRFPRFLLAKERGRLAEAASLRLQDLSRGSYRFLGNDAGDGEDPLLVVDTARAGQRRPGTLSGGERFLASLALALALGDIAAGAGGRLDCLFLDEGFSALDADSLELAIAALERLAGRGRLIAVITHLPGVAERLGDAIRVAKDPSGISRVLPPG